MQEPEGIKLLLENPNFNPARKKSSFHQFFNAFIWNKYY